MTQAFRYDFTVVRKENNSEYKVFFVYPNEDNGKLTPVIWESHHYWDGKSTITEFSNDIENKAYLHENYKKLEEALLDLTSHFTKNNKKWFFNSDEELQANLNKLNDGDLAIHVW